MKNIFWKSDKMYSNIEIIFEVLCLREYQCPENIIIAFSIVRVGSVYLSVYEVYATDHLSHLPDAKYNKTVHEHDMKNDTLVLFLTFYF